MNADIVHGAGSSRRNSGKADGRLNQLGDDCQRLGRSAAREHDDNRVLSRIAGIDGVHRGLRVVPRFAPIVAVRREPMMMLGMIVIVVRVDVQQRGP